LNKSADKRLETVSKKWVIKELDLINRLTKAITQFMDITPKKLLEKLKQSQIIREHNVTI
jgi:hypothetical protein